MKAGASKSRWLWGAVVAVVVLYGLNYVFTPDMVGITELEAFFRPKGKLQFDANKWKQKHTSSWGDRYEMVDDLLRTQLTPGRSQREVEDLLGKPDIAAPRDAGEVEMHYTLISQKDRPARSLLFPGRLGNLELWILLLRFREGRLYSARVIAT